MLEVGQVREDVAGTRVRVGGGRRRGERLLRGLAVGRALFVPTRGLLLRLVLVPGVLGGRFVRVAVVVEAGGDDGDLDFVAEGLVDRGAEDDFGVRADDVR